MQSKIDLTPELIKNGTLDYAEYMLSVNGLLSDSVPWVNINNKFQLIQQHPYSSIYVCPIKPNGQPTIEEIWQINDYLSYMNEIPSIPLPETTSFKNLGYEYLYSRNRKDKKICITDIETGDSHTRIVKPEKKYELENRTYLDTYTNILSEIYELKYGPFAGMLFFLSGNKPITIDMEKEFKPIEKEVHFYAMSLRQADCFAELLFYYRIFESISPSNRHGLLNNCIEKIATHNFGILNIRNTRENYNIKPKNVYKLMKKRALKQIKELKEKKQITDIGKYLYKNERCEIAHGTYSKRISSLGKEYFNTFNNMLIIKLAAKIAIYDKLRLNSRRTTAST